MNTLVKDGFTVAQLMEELEKVEDKNVIVNIFDGMNVWGFEIVGVDEDDGVVWINAGERIL